jgi:tripartite-type tricarboxylate transporter receptor subunit TctC
MRHLGVLLAFVGIMVGFAIKSSDAEAAYPDRIIKIVVPFAPGGPIDGFARPLAAAMQEIMGTSVVIENRSGGGGIPGTESVANSRADGYTLLMTGSSHIGNKAFNSVQVHYDPLRSFTPIAGLIETNGVVLIARKDIPVEDLSALIAYGKSVPNSLTFGHAGVGNISYVAGELLKAKTGMPLSAIPYRGTSAVLTDILSGQVDLCFMGLSLAREYVESKQVKAIASTGTKSIPVSGVPTMQEAGLDFVLLSYIGLWAPRDLPDAIVTSLHEAVKQALARPKIQELFNSFGGATQATGPVEFARFLEQDTAIWERLARELGVK